LKVISQHLTDEKIDHKNRPINQQKNLQNNQNNFETQSNVLIHNECIWVLSSLAITPIPTLQDPTSPTVPRIPVTDLRYSSEIWNSILNNQIDINDKDKMKNNNHQSSHNVSLKEMIRNMKNLHFSETDISVLTSILGRRYKNDKNDSGLSCPGHPGLGQPGPGYPVPDHLGSNNVKSINNWKNYNDDNNNDFYDIIELSPVLLHQAVWIWRKFSSSIRYLYMCIYMNIYIYVYIYIHINMYVHI
jgi:hypothetical protein